MHLNRLCLLAFGAAAVDALTDTSPFFLASTSEVPISSEQSIAATSLLDSLSTGINSCPSEYYVVAFQPGVHYSDFKQPRSAPRLGGKMRGEDKSLRSTSTIDEVAGVLDAKQIQEMIEMSCGTQTTVIDASSGIYPSTFDTAHRVVAVDFPMLPEGEKREGQLLDNDGLLADIIERIPSSDYTLIYVTSPREDGGSESTVQYSVDNAYQDSIHQDLKRDFSAHVRRVEPASNKTLFHNYEFFTPGIFMGIIATLIFVMILSVAFSALSSLEVSYAAFEKDTAPSSQKKQQ
ncbi:hypothetical protein ASPZODRAFT_136816 [Penicilliopsis zonata CBS 506.65]|uniref:Protein BIG1 n=1 Tax=Penicilliopsis zonata CBS 506.65 TaxID=1073090 RepID=A0A1L9S713_9EURO|nr:hypothetical protein ASPZODRAFT_136816 [Penicilliopsis zonata CBS 506.65]OJJ42951.1 hypothetical protein ASPZODRAFT_136816 [Penicilliopsis zonata CBS 506.65]